MNAGAWGSDMSRVARELTAIAEAARAALSAAFDDPKVSELRVFNLGDGEAMSGLLVAGRRGASGESTFLVFLMD